MKCLHPFFLCGQILPCGKCEACRGTYVCDWTVRFLCEAESFSRGAVFGTLTYDDKHLPEDANLCLKDVQAFFKRVKKRLKLYNIGTRYMYCGEYGTNRGRPHYHFVLTGLSPDKISNDELSNIINVIEKSWTFGFTSITPVVTPEAAIHYMIGYALKFEGKYAKKPGETDEQYFVREGRIAPFVRFSSGIGRRYCEDHKHEMIDKNYLEIGGKKFSLPRYFRKKILASANEKQLSKILFSQVEYLAEKLKKVSGFRKRFALELRHELLCEYEKNCDKYVNSLFFYAKVDPEYAKEKSFLKKRFKALYEKVYDVFGEDIPSFLIFCEENGYDYELSKKYEKICEKYEHLLRYRVIDLWFSTFDLDRKLNECRSFFVDEVVQSGKNFCFFRKKRMKKRVCDSVDHG